MAKTNTLYFGDNLEVLRRHIADESVDLVYLDPPFNSNADYNVLFAEKSGQRAHAQIQAFEDTWEWDAEAAANFADAVANGGQPVAKAMMALRTLLGGSDMLAYLSMMAPRLVELRRALKPTGSIYLHCDPTASHYLKLLMDAVFGPRFFQNEIIWKRTSARSDSHRWNQIHDVILFYSRTGEFIWNPQYTSYDQEYTEQFYGRKDEVTGKRYTAGDLTAAGTRKGESGQPWRGVNPTQKGRHWAVPMAVLASLNIKGVTVQDRLNELDKCGRIIWPEKKGGMPRYKRYLDEMPGVAIQSMITDIPPIAAHAAERLGYPTQKPEALLERIVNASSNEGDTVLDPFCGCGTTIAAAQNLKRRWIGIDITHLAINLIKVRLNDAFGKRVVDTYEVIGEPKDLEGAKALAGQDKYQFQYWALGLVGARPDASQEKKGADKGIDGRLWITEGPGQVRPVIISVKGGHVGVPQVRDLRGVVEREEAAIGVFICLEEPTQPMKREAADAGFYEATVVGKSKHLRLQILTIEELLAGKRIDMPASAEVRSFKQAPKAKGKTQKESRLFEAS